MEATELILNALSAGALVAVKDTASQAIKDGYEGLKNLVQRRLRNKPEAETALTKYEEEPEIWAAPLRDALVQTGAAQDEEIVEASRRLLTLINPQQAAMGKYNVQIAGPVQGFVQGDNANVSMTFSDKPPKE